MTEAIFNNLLKITLNIEGDSDEIDNIKFNPNMLYEINVNNAINVNKDGLLFSNNRKLSGIINEPLSSSYYYNSSCKDYSKKNRERVLNLLTKKWDSSIDTLYLNDVKIDKTKYRSDDDDLINKNINFINCFFFNKYNILTNLTGLNDNKVYIIAESKIKKDTDTGLNFKKEYNAEIDGIVYKRIYNLTINLKLINIFKPVYLTLNLAIETDKNRFNKIFVPSMIDYEIKKMKDENKSLSMYFSAFIKLDEDVLNRMVLGKDNIDLEKQKIFTDEKKMMEWIIDSFNKNKKLANWFQTNEEDIPKFNLRLINKIFFNKSKSNNSNSNSNSNSKSKLEIEEDKYYTIVTSSLSASSSPLTQLEIYNKLSLIYKSTFNIVVKEYNDNDIITLNIKIQHDSNLLDPVTARKNRKTITEFVPSMVNKGISLNEDKIFFIPYLELPSVNELKKFNENYMKIFTHLSEFLKLVEYLKYKNKFKKPFVLSNPNDISEIKKIVEKNIKIMKDIFFPPNGEINLNKKKKIVGYNENKKNELIYDDADTKSKSTFFIGKSVLINDNGLNFIATPPFIVGKEPPLKYTILVDLTLSDNKLSIFELTLNCKDNAKELDKKLNDLYNYANANTINKPSTFFSDLLKPDGQEILDKVRVPLYIRGGVRLNNNNNKKNKTRKIFKVRKVRKVSKSKRKKSIKTMKKYKNKIYYYNK